MKSDFIDIRSAFKSFFKINEHTILPSSNLVPNDPTLLFTNSGMVQFKDIFTGIQKTNLKRATTVQKCIRAGGKHNDLDNVGYTNRHHTFFEMLGNFSFGDYFKEEAIYFAFKFLTTELRISKERLYFTVFHEDAESFNIWQKLTGFGEDKILKIKTNDNFWSMGPTGPCGPCSEIFYDYGDGVEGGLPGTANENGARYTEIWNLVFMQFNQVDENTKVPLKQTGVDTGMGLERLISVLENKVDNYKTTLFENIIKYSKDVIGKHSKDNIAYRILADHVRSTAFLIADGVMPSSEGRGYVLRRIIRRALRHLYMIGYRGGDFHKITDHIVNLMGEVYPELEEARSLIHIHAKSEEEKFISTLPQGMKFLENEIKNLKQGEKLETKKAFMLYDTFGFPLDITNDILTSNNLNSIPEEDFEKEMEKQREKSRESWSGSGDAKQDESLLNFASNFAKTEFLGYDLLTLKSKVLGIQDDYIILEKTIFYPEGGGQIADAGTIDVIPVLDVIKINNVILHKLASVSGLKVGEHVDLTVAQDARKDAQNAHSATHILHYILRNKLGEIITQKGSFVGRNKLRFDFSFNRALTQEEIVQIELDVNNFITAGLQSSCSIKKLEEAKKQGAVALFGEKYEDNVRVVEIGNSIELCGGTHVSSSSEIMGFKITLETAVASGIRRIEAITGSEAIKYMLYASQNLEHLRSTFKLSKVSKEFFDLKEGVIKDEIINEVETLKTKIKNLEDDISNFKVNYAVSSNGINHKNYHIKTFQSLDSDIVKKAINKLKPSFEDKVLIIFSWFQEEEKGMLYISSALSGIDAKNLCNIISEKFGGKGGGSKEFASIGGIKQNISYSELTQLLP